MSWLSRGLAWLMRGICAGHAWCVRGSRVSHGVSCVVVAGWWGVVVGGE